MMALAQVAQRANVNWALIVYPVSEILLSISIQQSIEKSGHLGKHFSLYSLSFRNYPHKISKSHQCRLNIKNRHNDARLQHKNDIPSYISHYNPIRHDGK
jgi:hypothetical protein